jgi:hypothetical protein
MQVYEICRFSYLNAFNSVSMKKYTIFLSVTLLTACAWFAAHKNIFTFYDAKTGTSVALKDPGEADENPSLREAWERQMLADPATGKIPEGIQFQEQWFAAGMPKSVAERSGGGWASRGPWNVGGRTRALAMDITNENRILAGGVSGGIWLSEDAGQSWTRRTPLNAHPGCVSVAQDVRPGKTNTWYYLSGEVTGTSASGGGAFYLGDGMFKSTDGGLNWSPLSSTAGGNPNSFTTLYQSGWRVVTSPVDSLDVLYMATIGTVYRSVNGGLSWSAVRGGNISNYSYYVDVAISKTGVLYATLSSDGPQKGVWRSTNGTTWVNITPANFPPTYDRFVIGINPNNENEVYFVGSTPGYGHYNNYADSDDWSSLWKYTYVSGNGTGAGGTWEDRSQNLPSVGTEFDRFACQGGYDLVVKVQPGTNHVFVGGTNLVRSNNGFATPDSSNHIGGYKPGTKRPFFEIYPNHHPDQHDILFLPSNPNVLISASDGGLRRTENCNADTVTWTSLNRGYQTAQFYTAIFEKSIAGDNTLLGGLQDNGNFIVNSTSSTDNWKQTVNGDGAFGAIPDGKPYYLLSIQQGKVAKCAIDNQGNITARRRIDPIGPKKDEYLFVNPFALDPSNQNILYLPAGTRMYRQNDLASIQITGVWDTISQGWTQFPDKLADTTAQITALAVTKTNPSHRLYFGTSKGKLYKIDNADTGTPTFTTLPTPISSSSYISCIAVDPDNGNDVILVYSNYSIYSMWRSLDGGQTWQKVGGNLEANYVGSGNGPSIRWLSILPFPDGSRKYFCGTSVGLYAADSLKLHSNTLTGTQWTLQSPDMIGSAVVPYVDVRPVDGLVVAATHGSGMFSANFMPVSASHEAPDGVTVRITPNPARDACMVYLPVNLSETVSMVLYDLNGRTVRQIQLSGAATRLDLAGLAQGTYVYELQGRGWRKSGKVVKVE